VGSPEAPRCCLDRSRSPGLTAPAIVTVAAWMPSSRTPAAISVCAERRAAFPIERLASAGTGLSAKPPVGCRRQLPAGRARLPVPRRRRRGHRRRGRFGAARRLCRRSGLDLAGQRCTRRHRGHPGDEDPFERLAVAVQILHIRADRLYPKATVAQFRGELVDRFTAGDERAAEALPAEAPNHAGVDSRSGPDQQGGRRREARSQHPQQAPAVRDRGRSPTRIHVLRRPLTERNPDVFPAYITRLLRAEAKAAKQLGSGWSRGPRCLRNGAEGARTPDLRAASATLFQLSYSPATRDFRR
jgi:hypothetical protein